MSRARRWGRSSPMRTASEVRGYIDLGVDGRRRARRPTAARRRSTRRASSSGRPCSTGSSPSMRIYREEIFGPVLSVVRVPDFESALQLVNEHEYGNGTAIFTRDGDVGARLQQQREGRHGRRQRADSGADGVPLVRRLEAVAVRRPLRARARGRALLHAAEDDHRALADRHPQGRRIQDAGDG